MNEHHEASKKPASENEAPKIPETNYVGSASEPTATLTKMAAIRGFSKTHPAATPNEIVSALREKQIDVDLMLVSVALEAQPAQPGDVTLEPERGAGSVEGRPFS